jgi:hypothetical protein
VVKIFLPNPAQGRQHFTAREALAGLARGHYHPEIEALIRQKLQHVADDAVVEIEYHQHRPSPSPWASLVAGPQLPQQMLPNGSWAAWPSPDPHFVMRVGGVAVIDLPPGKLPSDIFIARLAEARHADAGRYLNALLSRGESEEAGDAAELEPEPPKKSRGGPHPVVHDAVQKWWQNLPKKDQALSNLKLADIYVADNKGHGKPETVRKIIGNLKNGK